MHSRLNHDDVFMSQGAGARQYQSGSGSSARPQGAQAPLILLHATSSLSESLRGGCCSLTHVANVSLPASSLITSSHVNIQSRKPGR